MSNSLFAFCEDSFCGTGEPLVVIIYYDAVNAKLVSYVWSPSLSTVDTESPDIDTYVQSAIIEILT